MSRCSERFGASGVGFHVTSRGIIGLWWMHLQWARVTDGAVRVRVWVMSTG